MKTKQALALGGLGGFAVGAAACLVVLVWSNQRITTAQADAYDQGFKAAFDQIQAQGGMLGQSVESHALAENERLASAHKAAIEELETLKTRDDLPQDAAAAIQNALDHLK